MREIGIFYLQIHRNNSQIFGKDTAHFVLAEEIAELLLIKKEQLVVLFLTGVLKEE